VVWEDGGGNPASYPVRLPKPVGGNTSGTGPVSRQPKGMCW
jgi:hypothetical protein